MKNSWLNTEQRFKGRMIGKLLGDGCITIQRNRKPRFQFIHAASDLCWSKYCYRHLQSHIPLNPPKLKKVIDPRLKAGYSLSYYTQSRTSNVITYLRSEWYPNSIKIIPFESIYKHFTVESLAWWYMDDGHLKRDKNKPQKIILSTDNFTRKENQQLIHFLYERFHLLFRLDKQNRLIIYDQYQIFYFLYLVTPFLHASMHRKALQNCSLRFSAASRRTTIYLPENLALTSPTKEINKALSSGLKLIKTDFKNGNFYKKYRPIIWAKRTQTKPYQIVINSLNLENLHFLKSATGLEFSVLSSMCFLN